MDNMKRTYEMYSQSEQLSLILAKLDKIIELLGGKNEN